MKRLVYSPYVEAFVKTADGVFDLSPYILSGSVNRKVNQVSGAQLTLRNPVMPGGSDLLFTEFPRADGVGPLISPMDPIVITMTRLQAHPVTVFTGYVDKAPYFQLYPGVCTLEASCTLKRLLYTQWDASLPFVEYFLQQFGWQLGTNGINNPSADAPALAAKFGQIQGQFTDGSLGGLLYAVLHAIGNWDDHSIYIEALPPQIKSIVTTLYNRIQSDVQTGAQLFNTYIAAILGGGAQGSAGGSGGASGVSTGTITNAAQIIPAIVNSATSNNVPSDMLVAIALIENNLQPTSCTSGSYAGTFQVQWQGGGAGRDGHPYPAGPWSTYTPTCAEANDVGLASNACAAAAAALSNLYGGASTQAKWNWAIHVQGVQGNNLGGQSAAYQSATGFAPYLARAQQLINQYNSHTPQSSPITSGPNSQQLSTVPSSTATTSTGSSTTQASGTSPGGKQGNVPTGGASPYVNPFSSTPTTSRVDMGVDYGGAGITVSTIGRAKIYLVAQSGFSGAYIGYTLLDGPHANQNVYVAEGITTLVSQGQTVAAGTPIAHMNGGIETGWADPGGGETTWFVTQTGIDWTQWDSAAPNPKTTINYSTAAGRDFNNFLISLGAPTGTVGPPVPGDKYTGVQSTASGGGTSTGSTGSTGSGGSPAPQSAFSTMIQLPSIFQIGEALAFTGKRSFMADQPLFPFISQLCQASMRNFMSMPDGSFFAFFPDYFGIFGRKYYWELHDIEILDARIDLCDDPLATHIAVAGDTYTYPSGQVTQPDLLLTSGIFDIFDAFTTGYVGASADPSVDLHNFTAVQTKVPANRSSTASNQDALAFLQKFGARPLVEEIPAIRNPFFELFYAFQTFMLLWSKQFETTFELTFMPELFPGGLVALPEHHLQVYLEEVVHYFDYEQGFTTSVSVSSPSQLDAKSRPNISHGLARPLTTHYQALGAGRPNQAPRRH